ncbi:MAG: hypothetical protein AB1762_18520 [Gemmatimonadota bacterium]
MRPCLGVLLGIILAQPTFAQTRTSAVLGGTWLDFKSLGGTAAGTAQLRLQRDALEISGFGIMPIGVTAAYADCIQDAPCPQRATPSALFGALVSLVSRPSASGWRGSVGGGFLTSSGLEWPGDHSSPAATIGLDWSQRRDGTALTLGMRVIGLTERVGSLRGVLLPAIGMNF